MKQLSIGTLALAAVLGLSNSLAYGQSLARAVPSERITAKINPAQRTVLSGHVPPAIRGAVDLGRVDPSTQLQHMIMVMSSSADQEHVLRSLIDQQGDKNASSYHKWLSPDEFQQQFGVSDADLAKLQDWLSAQGFTVEKVARGGRILTFSGSVGAFESAFQTEFHRFQVGGEEHISVNTELSVPSAISSVVRAIPTVHNFFKQSHLSKVRVEQFTRSQSGLTPLYTNGAGTSHYFGPQDFKVVYDTAPLLSAGVTGAGVKIGIIGRTDISLSDVQTYREMFNLPANDPTFIIAGEDPGTVPGDDGESYLDVEVSGGVAPGASINFITSKATLTVDGVDLSALYAVENNLVDILSESYGNCEATLGASSNAFQNVLWEQAAAQGISVFMSSGDNGPASCDAATSTYSSYGYAVSGLASTPYNVAVGGTMFAEGTGTYWSTTNSAGYGSALSYIPETPWNESKGSGSSSASDLWSGSGGISAYYATPAWQRGYGVPLTDPSLAGTGAKSDPTSPVVAGPHRYLPDVSLNAASGHDPTFYCGEGVCELSSSGSLVNAGLVGGTSVASPEMAGIQALIDQANGGRQGQPNYYYYALSQANYAAGLSCASAGPPAAGCAFHDITSGNNLICGNSSCTTAYKIGWTAGAGYDLATGIGSPDAYQLSTQWNTVTFSSSVTTLAIPTVGSTHGTASTLNIAVAAGSGSGTPTGAVAILASNGSITDPVDETNGGFTNQVALCNLSGGSCTINLSTLPAGSYSVIARYAGDSTYGSSTSAPVPVSVTSENSGLTLSANTINCTTDAITSTTSFTYGSLIFLDAKVAGNSNQGVPTGTISITDNGAPLTSQSLNSTGDLEIVSGAIPSTSCVYGYSYVNLPSLTVGTHVLSASYSGDGSFNASTLATPVTITVTPAALTTSLKTTSTYAASGASVNLILTLTPLNATALAAAPSGTVTFTDTTTSTVLGAVTVSAGSYAGTSYSLASLVTTGLTTTGAHSISAAYSGDANYAASSSTVTVTVGGASITGITVTSSTNPATVAATNTLTATATYSGTAPTGTIYFYDGSTVIGTGTLSSAKTTLATQKLLGAGTHTITAVYGGNSTYSSYTSATPLSLVVNKATPTLNLTAKNKANVGDTVTMTTVVTVSENTSYVAYVAPTGTVQFYDGSTALGSPVSLSTVPYANGGYGIYEAVYSTSTLAAGTHTITATYTDPNYATTTTNTQTVAVSGKPLGNLELAVDNTNSSSTVLQNDKLFISGWAADAVDGVNLASVVVKIDGNSIGTPTLGIARADVASAYSNTAYTNSGFQMVYDPSLLTVGSHAATVLVTNSGGQSTTLGPLSFTVKANAQAPLGNLEMAVDSGTQSTTIPQTDKLWVSGWAADTIDGSALASIIVYVDGVAVGSPVTGQSRPDVATTYGKSAYANSGYYLLYNASQLTAGTHAITVVATDTNHLTTTFGPLNITVTAVHKAPAGNLELAVDNVTATSTVSQADMLWVSGWAGDYQANSSVAAVTIYIDGAASGAASLGLARPDVAAAFSKPGWANTGWSFVTSASALPVGTHTVTAIATDSVGLSTTFGPLAITVQ